MSEKISTPKFCVGSVVKCKKESGCQLVGGIAIVIDSKYISNKYWSGWTYKLSNAQMLEPIEIGEIWLELVSSSAKDPIDQILTEINFGEKC